MDGAEWNDYDRAYYLQPSLPTSNKQSQWGSEQEVANGNRMTSHIMIPWDSLNNSNQNCHCTVTWDPFILHTIAMHCQSQLPLLSEDGSKTSGLLVSEFNYTESVSWRHDLSGKWYQRSPAPLNQVFYGLVDLFSYSFNLYKQLF